MYVCTITVRLFQDRRGPKAKREKKKETLCTRRIGPLLALCALAWDGTSARCQMRSDSRTIPHLHHYSGGSLIFPLA
jgi:hypothetical protein